MNAKTEKLKKIRKTAKEPALSFIDRMFALVMADTRQFLVDDVDAGLVNEYLSVTDIVEFFGDDHAAVEMLEKIAGMKINEKRCAGHWVVTRLS